MAFRKFFGLGAKAESGGKQLSGPKYREARRKLISQNTTLCSNIPGCATYLLNLKPVLAEDGEETRKLEFGTPVGTRQEKTIMLLGATGSGKTTLLNAMINYVFGVEWEDDFRVRLIPEEDGAADQAQSQTQVLTSYTLHYQDWFRVPFTLTIVDTPGFGDTRGKEMDKQITGQIETFFKTKGIAGLDHVSVIGFVVQSSLARLTGTQKYIFNSILSLFGNDIQANIIPLLTFADNKLPKALQALQAAEVNTDVHFKFNSSGLFDNSDKNDPMDRGCWMMGITSFKGLFEKVLAIEEKSLLLTQELMKEKETLKTKLEDIIKEIDNGTTMLMQFEKEKAVMKQHEANLDANKKFSYTVTEKRKKLESTGGSWQAKNCISCERTCHYPCGEGYWCSAVNWGGSCKVCGCDYSRHSNTYEQYISETVQVTKTSEDIKKRYQKAKGEIMTKEKILKRFAEDVERMKNEVISNNVEARKCITRIQEIALKPNPISVNGYLDKMIQREENEKKSEYKARIKQLENVKKISEFLDELVAQKFDLFTEQSVIVAKIKEKYDALP